jgi:hypothetical protein
MCVFPQTCVCASHPCRHIELDGQEVPLSRGLSFFRVAPPSPSASPAAASASPADGTGTGTGLGGTEAVAGSAAGLAAGSAADAGAGGAGGAGGVAGRIT